MTVDPAAGPADRQALKPAKPVDLNYVQALPEPKRTALLAILTHSDFEG
jgi:hypothetical protein